MIRLKTAVMIAGCLKAGAILSQTSPKNQQIAYDIGINIGIAFQLKDDLLDIYGDNTVFGKINGDIKENKNLSALRAIEDATPEQKLKLSLLITTDSKFEEKFMLIKNFMKSLKLKRSAKISF